MDATVTWELDQKRMSSVKMTIVRSSDMREILLIGTGEVVVGDKVSAKGREGDQESRGMRGVGGDGKV